MMKKIQIPSLLAGAAIGGAIVYVLTKKMGLSFGIPFTHIPGEPYTHIPGDPYASLASRTPATGLYMPLRPMPAPMPTPCKQVCQTVCTKDVLCTSGSTVWGPFNCQGKTFGPTCIPKGTFPALPQECMGKPAPIYK